MKRISLICVISVCLMFLLGAVWFFQTSALAKSSEELSQAEERLVELRDALDRRSLVQEIGIDKLAEDHFFEKIESVSYLEAVESTALAK